MELTVGQKSVNILKANRAKYLHVESSKMQKLQCITFVQYKAVTVLIGSAFTTFVQMAEW